APLLLPLWLGILNRTFSYKAAITEENVIGTVAGSVLIPLFLGLAIRAVSPRVAKALVRPVNYFFIAAIVVAIPIVLYLGAPVLEPIPIGVFLAVALIVIGSEALGYWSAAPVLEERRTMGVAAAMGNPGLALAVIAATRPDIKTAAAAVVAYILL